LRKTLRNEIAGYILADYIANGKLGEGDSLPPVRDLQKTYGVSTGTILSAIAILEAQGVFNSRVGSGCYFSGPVDE